MNRKRKFFSEEVVLLNDQSSDEKTDFEDSEDSDDELHVHETSEPILYLHLAESSDEEWDSNTSQQPEKKLMPSDFPDSEPVSSRKGLRQSARLRASKTCSPSVPRTPEERWNNSTDEDITPRPAVFKPSRRPGPQLNPSASYSVLKLFQLFISPSVVQTIVQNTNAYGAKHQKANPQWKDISWIDLYSYLLLVIYMGMLKMHSLTDYWRKSDTFKIPFPAEVMSARRFYSISSALHLSDPEADAENKKKMGTPAYDSLCKIKPMYQQLREACKQNFHPFQNITIDERKVETKPKNLSVLSDSLSAYTWDFFIQESKSTGLCPQSNTLGCESVMELVDEQMLGTGYKLFLGKVNTSPALFRDLLGKNIWACGTVRSNRPGYPKTMANKLPRKAPRGTHRWLREEDLLFVEWNDKKEVRMCSTMHRGNGGSTLKRIVKGSNGQRTTVDVPVPECVIEYNRRMSGAVATEALFCHYSVSHKTRKWYRRFFYDFVDIAIANAFVLHREMASTKKQKPMTHKQFREKLVEELAMLVLPDFPSSPPSPPEETRHLPGHFASDSTKGRRNCKVCGQKTPVYCKACLVAMCFQPKRDCFFAWHNQH